MFSKASFVLNLKSNTLKKYIWSPKILFYNMTIDKIDIGDWAWGCNAMTARTLYATTTQFTSRVHLFSRFVQFILVKFCRPTNEKFFKENLPQEKWSWFEEFHCLLLLLLMYPSNLFKFNEGGWMCTLIQTSRVL